MRHGLYHRAKIFSFTIIKGEQIKRLRVVKTFI